MVHQMGHLANNSILSRDVAHDITTANTMWHVFTHEGLHSFIATDWLQPFDDTRDCLDTLPCPLAAH